ncbi:MAG TPA: YjbE family putative metal transport protein [Caulobacteraceae bacterium]|jgi:YjbE family integral membrane protein|nr:YjbE family putative metal transport protein [Caulobacteraceae bacterium]
MAELTSHVHSILAGGLLGAFIQIVLIDVTLASDNAVAVGMAASGLPRRQRHLAILLGLSGAVVLLCVLAVFAVRLLKAGGGGLVLGGGLLLALVGLQMWRDLRTHGRKHGVPADRPPERKALLKALTLIFVADMSTSLDNVLAVAGVARDQPQWVLFAGLTLSVALTGFAATGVVRLLNRWPWVGYVGLAVVLFVAAHMVWDGAEALKWIRI